jgi:hypothetical protein
MKALTKEMARMIERHYFGFLPVLLGMWIAACVLSQPFFADGYACTYDSLNRIKSIEYHNGLAIQFTYDAAGNMTYEVVSGGGLAGDVDGNGAVNVGDALAILQCTVSDCSPDRTWCPACPSYTGSVCRADVNDDQVVSVADALNVLQCSVARCTPAKPWCVNCGAGLVPRPDTVKYATSTPNAGDCVQLSVESVTANPGQAVEVLVRIAVPASIQLAALQFRLNFDTSQLEVIPANSTLLDNLVVTDLSAPDACASSYFAAWNKSVGPAPYSNPGYLQVGLMSTTPLSNLTGVCLLKIKGNGSDIVRVKSGATPGAPPSALTLTEVLAFDNNTQPVAVCAPQNGTLSVVGCSTLSTGVPTTTSVPLSWTAVAGATSYNVYRVVNGANCTGGTLVKNWTDLGNLAWTDTGLTPNTRYCYNVSPVGSTCTPASNCVCATTCSTALALTSPSQTTSSISLQWTKAPGASGYQVYRKTGTDCTGASLLTTVTGENTTSYADSGLAEQTAYSYVVKPLDMGCDEATNCLTASTTATPCVKVKVVSLSASPGADLNILLRIDVPSALSVASAQLRLTFDPSVVEVLPASVNDLDPLAVTSLLAPDACGSAYFGGFAKIVGPTPYTGQAYLDIGLMSTTSISGLSDACFLRVKGDGSNRIRVEASAVPGTVSALGLQAVQFYDATSQALLACIPQNGTLTVSSAAPPPVPDGKFVTRDKVFRLAKTATAGNLTADWSTQCAAPGYHIVEFDLQALRQSQSWIITGVHCGAVPGQAFTIATAPATTLVGFLVAGDDGGTTEGSYGFSSSGQPRTLTVVGNPLNTCGITSQNTTGTCQ